MLLLRICSLLRVVRREQTRRSAGGIGCADTAKRALLSDVVVRSTTVERVWGGGEKLREYAGENTPAAWLSGARRYESVAGYDLTGRALTEPEEACDLKHAAHKF
jgi:hypothetical protein